MISKNFMKIAVFALTIVFVLSIATTSFAATVPILYNAEKKEAYTNDQIFEKFDDILDALTKSSLYQKDEETGEYINYEQYRNEIIGEIGDNWDDAEKISEAVTKAKANENNYASEDLKKEFEEYEVISGALEIKEAKALDAKTIEITFVKELEEDFDLTDKEIKVNDMIAKYVADSYDADAKTAKFELAEDEDELVDAEEYTITSDWTKDAAFVAKIAEPYINEVVVITKDVPALEYVPASEDGNEESGVTRIYFTAKNQYGEDIELTEDNTEKLAVEVRINNMPLLEGQEVDYTKVNDYIEIRKSLVENDNLSIKFVNEINDEKKVVGEKEFIVIKGEDSVATTIGNLKAVYVGGENDGKEVTSLAAGDQVKLTVEVKDQYGNPMESETVRWVVEDGSELIEKEEGQTADAVDFTFTAKKAGNIKIVAYLRNGKNVVYEKEIGAARLTGITFVGETPATKYNNEEIVLGKITPNEGAVLTPDMIDFKVEPEEGLTEEDITVEAKLRGGKDESKADDIVVVAKTTKTGTYNIIPFVVINGEEVAADTIKLTTEVNPDVEKIVIGDLGDQILTNGGQVKVDVTITNKHGEVLIPNNFDEYSVIVSNPNIVSGILDTEDVKDADGKVVGEAVKLIIEGKADEGKATLHIVKGTVESNKIEVETNKASQPAELRALETIEVVEDAAPSLHKVEIRDQYGNVIYDIDDITLNEVVGESEDANKLNIYGLVYYTEDEEGNLSKTDHQANADGIAVKLEIADGVSVENGDVVKVKAVVGEKEIGELTVNLKEKAKLAEINVVPITETVTIGAKGYVKVETKDQYGKFIIVDNYDLYVKLDDASFEKIDNNNLDKIDKDGKEPDNPEKAVAYKLEIDGLNTAGEVVVTVANGSDPESEGFISDTATITVKAAQDVIETVEIVEVGEVNNYDANNSDNITSVELKAVARDKDGKEVAVPDGDFVWDIVSAVDEEGNPVSVGSLEDNDNNNVVELSDNELKVKKGQTVIVEVSVMTPNGKEDTAVIKFVNEAPKATSDLKIEKATKVSYDGSSEEVEIKDNAIEIEEGNVVRLELSAKDQYGNKLDDDKITDVKALSGNKTVATVEGKEITAHKEGNALITIKVGDLKVQLTVNVKPNLKLRKAEEAIAQVPKVSNDSDLSEIAEAMKAQDKIDAAEAAIAAAVEAGVDRNSIAGISAYDSTKYVIDGIIGKDADVDYKAVLNTSHHDEENIKGYYFIKITVEGLDLNEGNIKAIYSINSEKYLTPDSEKVLWFRVASEEDTDTQLHEDGTYEYLVKANNGEIYKFSFEFNFNEVEFPEVESDE